MSDVERILVRLPNWLGDVLLARPLLHALRRACPGASVAAVAPHGLLDLLAADGVIDRPEPWPAAGRGRRALLERLRAWRPNVALVLPPSFSSAWFAWRTGAAVRIGYGHEGRSPLLTRALPRAARGDVHLADEYLRLGSALGAGAGPTPALAPPAATLDGARRLLALRGLDRERLALLAPGAVFGPAKRWPAERFTALGSRLAERGMTVLVCGAAAEREVCERVAAGTGRGALALAGHTGLDEQAGLCALAEIAVCNDSGMAHLAAAVGTPTVVVFGSTSSAWTAPIGPRVRIVQRAPVCSPCFRRTCRIGYRCLTAVTADDVDRAVDGLLPRAAA